MAGPLSPPGCLRLHPAAQRLEEVDAHAGADEAGQGLLQGEVHGAAGPHGWAAEAERRTVGGAGPRNQLARGDDILASAFEQRDDKLCAARQLVDVRRLPLEEVLSDLDTICDRGWQERGVTPRDPQVLRLAGRRRFS